MKILAYKGKSWISKAIRWQTRSDYSHIGIELSDGTVVEAWHVGGVSNNENFKTVHTKGTKVDVFEIIGDFDESAARAYAMSRVGNKYDFTSIWRFMSRRDEPADNKDFCSELGMLISSAGGIDLLKRVPASHVSPGHLVTSPLLTYVSTRTV